MAHIEKKIWPEYFEAVLSGKKKFEVRLSDFGCQVGDTLILREWDPETKKYTGRKLEKPVSYLVRTKDLRFWHEDYIDRHGFLIIGF